MLGVSLLPAFTSLGMSARTFWAMECMRAQTWSLISMLSQYHIKLLLVGCLTFQQHASVSQGRICSNNCPCCHPETEVADQIFYLTQSQTTDTRPTWPYITRRLAGQPLEYQFSSHRMTRPAKRSKVKARIEPCSAALEADLFSTIKHVSHGKALYKYSFIIIHYKANKRSHITGRYLSDNISMLTVMVLGIYVLMLCC